MSCESIDMETAPVYLILSLAFDVVTIETIVLRSKSGRFFPLKMTMLSSSSIFFGSTKFFSAE